MHLTLSSVLGIINLAYFEAWLSLVERCVRDAEVVGSNPVASTFTICMVSRVNSSGESGTGGRWSADPK